MKTCIYFMMVAFLTIAAGCTKEPITSSEDEAKLYETTKHIQEMSIENGEVKDSDI